MPSGTRRTRSRWIILGTAWKPSSTPGACGRTPNGCAVCPVEVLLSPQNAVVCSGGLAWTARCLSDPTLGREHVAAYGGVLQLSAGEGSEHAEGLLAVMFPAELLTFVNAQTWTFAKTMPEWPHEYIVRDRVDEKLFVRLVEHIRAHGYEGRFYQRAIIYYEEAGLVYWTMGAPLDETIIINRCRKEDTYEERLRRGTLPESRVKP